MTTKKIKDDKKEKIMKKKLFTKIAALAMTAVLALGSVNISPKAEDSYLTRTPNPETYEYDYQPEQGVNPLYAATKFHIFAQESASLSAHCNGNMATPLMHHNVNSGSNKVYADVSGTEITYIGQLAPNFNGTFAATTDTHIVFGRETEIKLMNGIDVFASDANGNYSKVNTNKDLIYKEGSEDYIDFEDEFDKLNKLSLNLAKEASTASINENVVTMPAGSDTYYINADSSEFMNRAFIIENCDFAIGGQALVINVNVGTATTYELPFTQVLLKEAPSADIEGDGLDFGTGEDKGKYTGCGNVLWNFYGTDANGNIVPFNGTLKTCTEFKGTVLAPSATITTAASNQDGNFIGKVVNLGAGETHRWDFGGKLKNYAPTGTVTVVVKDDKGNPISDVAIKVTDTKNNAYDLETGDDGITTTLNNLPLDRYTATITVPEGYELAAGEKVAESATITEAKPDATIDFIIKKKEVAPETGYFHITVTDKDTGALVPDVKVTITENGSNTVVENLTTGTTGKVDSSKMNLPTDEDAAWDKYDIAITVPDGYMMADGSSNKITDELTDANPDKIEFVIVKKPIPTGAIQIEVVSKNAGSDEERAVEGAKVTIKDDVDHIVKEVTVTTDDDGYTPVVDKLELIKYTTTIDESTIPDGFKLETGEAVVKNVTVEKENEIYKVKYILVQEAGSLVVKVTDEDGKGVSGVTVEIFDNDNRSVGEYKTDNKGLTDELYNLDADDEYTAKIVGVPEGYEVVVSKGTEIIVDSELVQIDLQVKKIPTAGVKATVVTEDGTEVSGVEVVVKDSKDNDVTTLVTGGTTDTVKDLELGDYKTTITVPDGYKLISEDATVDVILSEKDKIYEVEYVIAKEVKTGDIKVTVTDLDGNLIEGATVKITDSDGNPAGTADGVYKTNNKGLAAEITKLPAGNKYVATVTAAPEGYVVSKTTDYTTGSNTIVADKCVEIVLKVEEESAEPVGNLHVIITDAVTGELIKGAEIVVKDSKGNVKATVTTDKTGEFTVKDLPEDIYTVETVFVPDGYTAPDKETQTVVANKTAEVPLEVEKIPGSLSVVITDSKTGDVIPDAKVEITNDEIGYKETFTTDENGKISVDKLYPGDYTVTTTEVPKDYNIPGAKTDTVESGKNTNVPLTVEKEPGDLIVTITDAITKQPIAGATIVVKNDKINYEKEVTTDETGKFTIEDLYPGDYEIITEKIPDTYEPEAKPDDTSATVVSGGTTQKDLLVPSDDTQDDVGNLQVTIRDKYTEDPIKGATVVITSKDDPDFKKEVTTDENGQIKLEDLEPGDYVITTTKVPEGYTAPDEETDKVIAGQTTVVDLIVFKPGKLDVTIIDKDTEDPIPDAIVQIIDKTTNKVVEEVKTNEDGNVIVDNLEPGDYIIHVPDVPEYEEPGDKTVTVKPGETTPEKLEVEKDVSSSTPVEQPGSLDITIIDRLTQNPIPEAKVEIIDKTTNKVVEEVTTDKNGNVVVDNLEPGDYIIHVVDTPQYAEPADEPAKVESGKTTNKTLVVEKVGQMQITITDKNDPTKPIPNATVVVKDKEGNTVATLVTNGNGQTDIVKDLTIGETFTIETVTVPEGYTPPTPTTQKITRPELEIVKLEVSRDSGVTSSVGSLYVIITDKNTGDVIPDATVEVSNSKGEKIQTVVTDKTGSFTITNLKPDTYTIKTTKVPAGYTAPETQTAGVKSNARTDVHLYVAKEATNTNKPNIDTVVQTGDDSNVGMAGVLALISVLGIAVIMFMKKREEA